MTPAMKEVLLALAIQQTPAIAAGIRALFVTAHPDEVPPTDEEVFEAQRAAFFKSLAVDDAWLAAHPDWNK